MSTVPRTNDIPRGVHTGSDGKIRITARRIGIIGAGPMGLVTAKVFSRENKRHSDKGNPVPFESITVLERNIDIGGSWLYTPDPVIHYNVPQPDTKSALLSKYDERSESTGGFPTPMYDGLRTNLPQELMTFADHAFPDSIPKYPSRAQMEDYLRTYAEKFELHKYIQLNTEVTSAVYDEAAQEWKCTVTRLTSGSTEEMQFDALVLATGRFIHPCIPQITGLSNLWKRDPGCIVHSKEFRRPEMFSGQHVLVLGSSPSAVEIARKLTFADGTRVDRSVLDLTTNIDMLDPTRCFGQNEENHETVYPKIRSIVLSRYGKTEDCSGELTEYVEFVDGSIIPIPDKIIFATGYLSLYSFLKNQDGELVDISDGKVFNDMYKFLVYINNPTLSVLGVYIRTFTNSMAEYQALFLSAIFQGAPLPSRSEMKELWDDLTKDGNRLKIYINSLHQDTDEKELFDVVLGIMSLDEAKEYHGIGYTPDEIVECRHAVLKEFKKHGY